MSKKLGLDTTKQLILMGDDQDFVPAKKIFLLDGTNEAACGSFASNETEGIYRNSMLKAGKIWSLSVFLRPATTAAGISNIFLNSGFGAGDSGLQIYRTAASLFVQHYSAYSTGGLWQYNTFFTANTAIHLYITWNGNASGFNKINVYKNGVFVGASSTSGTSNDFSGTTSSGSIPYWSYNANAWNGYMSSPMALDAGVELAGKLYNNGRAGYFNSLKSKVFFAPNHNKYYWTGSQHNFGDYKVGAGLYWTSVNCEEGDLVDNTIFI